MSNFVNRSILKKVIIGTIIWFILTMILYSVSYFIHQDILILLTGGARNLFIVLVITFIAFFISYALPQIIFTKSEKEPLISVYILQLILILVLTVLGYVIVFKLIWGFNIWEVEMKFTSDIQQAIYIRLIGFIVISLISGFLGLKCGRYYR